MKVPLRLTLKVWSHSSRLVSSLAEFLLMPALLQAMWIVPHFETMSSIILWTSSGLLMSADTAMLEMPGTTWIHKNKMIRQSPTCTWTDKNYFIILRYTCGVCPSFKHFLNHINHTQLIHKHTKRSKMSVSLVVWKKGQFLLITR